MATQPNQPLLTTKCTIAVLASAIIACCLIGTNRWGSEPKKDQQSEHALPIYFKTRHLSSSKMPHDASYQDIAESRVPILLTDTIADKWLARKTFTTTFLMTKLPQISVHYQNNNRIFMTFHDNKPYETLLLDETWKDYNNKLTITIKELLEMTNIWYYYSQDVIQLKSQFSDILHYIQPVNQLILSEDNVQVNLWVGRAGIITSTHYDATYNFFVQLQGRKRFTLFPPNQTLYLYPCLHPHYGHSQIDILNPNVEMYPLFKDSEAVVAEVGPGDMLVVPPFWFHHVETLEESISINVWSDAPEYAIMNEIYKKPIPFENNWDWSELVIATRLYVKMILGSLSSVNPDKFIHFLFTQRYMPLIARGNIAFNKGHFDEINNVLSSVTNWEEKEELYKLKLKKGLDKILPLFEKIPIE